MTIDPIWRKPEQTNKLSTNGGRMTRFISPSNALENLFQNISNADRVAGVTLRAKSYLHFPDANNSAVLVPRFHLLRPTQSTDYAVFFPTTFDSTQADWEVSPRRYGAGTLVNDVIATSTVIQVTENTPFPMFYANDLVRVFHLNITTGELVKSDLRTVTSLTRSNGVVTLNLDNGLSNDYTVTNTATEITVVASVYTHATTQASVSNVILTSQNGAFSGVINLNGLSTISQVFTLDFTSATAGTITGDKLGLMGNFNVSGEISPSNQDFSAPYFTIPSGALSGSFASGDRLVFRTDPHAIPLVYEYHCPADMPATSVIIDRYFFGES